jgi:hypothetical protein
MTTKHKSIINQRSSTTWDSYTACGIAEGFDDPDDDFGTLNDKNIEAWAYLIATGQAWRLQGWYGRTASAIIDGGTINSKGVINWAAVEQAREDN